MRSHHPRTVARRSPLFLLSLGACLLSPAAWATPDPPEPQAWRATPIPVPDTLEGNFVARVPPSAAGHAKANTFFLNYDGVTLKKGNQDNSATNTTVFNQFAATYQPYGAGNKRAASLQAVKADWLKYDVTITDVRPNSGLYTMCVNSPTNVIGQGVLGVAPLDCFDNMAANIVLAFHSANDQFSATTQATTMSQEIAHAYGLEHVNQPNDIMNPYNAGGDPSFLDQCLQLDGGGNPIMCGQQHQQFCNNGQQNSHAELVWLFGLSEPDLEPPTVTITSPKHGDQLVAPATVTVVAEAADNDAIAEVNLYIDGDDVNAPDTTVPYQWVDAVFPEGTYCLVARALDDSQNEGSSPEVCFSVVKEGNGTTTSGGGMSTTTTTTGEPGNETTGTPTTGEGTTGEVPTTGATGGPGTDTDDTGSVSGASGFGGWSASSALPPGFGEGDDGCGCVQRGGAGQAGGLLLVALLGLVRRRRRA